MAAKGVLPAPALPAVPHLPAAPRRTPSAAKGGGGCAGREVRVSPPPRTPAPRAPPARPPASPKPVPISSTPSPRLRRDHIRHQRHDEGLGDRLPEADRRQPGAVDIGEGRLLGGDEGLPPGAERGPASPAAKKGQRGPSSAPSVPRLGGDLLQQAAAAVHRRPPSVRGEQDGHRSSARAGCG